MIAYYQTTDNAAHGNSIITTIDATSNASIWTAKQDTIITTNETTSDASIITSVTSTDRTTYTTAFSPTEQ